MWYINSQRWQNDHAYQTGFQKDRKSVCWNRCGCRKRWCRAVTATSEEVTYSDGTTEEVYAFDVPVEALDQEFDLAILGTKEHGMITK